MIGLLQRVKQASIRVSGHEIARIDSGLLVFIGVEQHDQQQHADRLLHKLLGYRVFEDEQGKMNLSLSDKAGSLLLVPQFTLAADTHKGMRPSFSKAANPTQAELLFNYICRQAAQQHPIVETGQFAADMQVSLINDGPVTFWLHVPATE